MQLDVFGIIKKEKDIDSMAVHNWAVCGLFPRLMNTAQALHPILTRSISLPCCWIFIIIITLIAR